MRKKNIGIGLIVIVILFKINYLSAQDAGSGTALIAPPQPKIMALTKGIDGLISLDLRKIDINDALKYFSLKSGLNIVTTKSVMGRITLVVEDVPVQDVFDIMLRSNGLAYDKIGDIYNVMTQEEYRVIYGKSFSDIRKVKVFHLNYAIPEQAFNLLDAVKSEVGRILVDQESGNILCMDSKENLVRMEELLEQFEQKSIVKVFTLDYANAKTVEETLNQRLSGKKVGSIKADERSNQVIVQTFPKRMEEIAELIKALDKKTKQVLIDVKIVKSKISDALDKGIEWEGLFDAASDSNSLTYIGSAPFSSVGSATADWRSRRQVYEDVGNVGSYPFSGTTSVYNSSNSIVGLNQMHVGIIGGNDLDMVLTYIQTVTSSKLLSNPKIAVTNNQEARIHVGAREAYVTTTTTTGQSTSTISEDVQFIDIGIQMDVVPRINEDGFVDLKIKAEVSSVIQTLVTPTGNNIPIVDTSLAETNALIKDGATLVLGGLRREEKSQTKQRVPFLSSIPILGLLFQKTNDTKNVTELLIMITPTIISGEVMVSSDGDMIGDPGIKPAQNYELVDRIKQEQQTYLPPPSASDLGGMEIKSFKPYKRSFIELQKEDLE
ncbi:MAG: secretin N-terminal domain-containing protein [Candidatus Omnitrophota bacterium]